MELSEIALQKLLQLFPEISNYIISFKDVTQEAGKEESGLQIGMFIVQFGEEFYYIPVIAKNETVLPIDSLFSATEGTFFPLTRTFLDKVISSSQVYLGKATTIPKTVTKNPSVYEMVTPPRTGKFVYASSSRLVEFLATMPNFVKKAMVEKFSSDKEVYQTMHRLFGLENLMVALKPSDTSVNVSVRPGVELITGGTGLDNDAIKSILEKGYALRGEHVTERVAVLANEYEKLGPLHQISGADVGADYEIVTRTGETNSAYIPKRARRGSQVPALLRSRWNDGGMHTDGYSHYGDHFPMFMLFANGDYAIGDAVVARGEAHTTKKVLKDLFAHSGALMPKHAVIGDRIALFNPDLDLIGAYSVSKATETQHGITLEVYSLIPGISGRITINAYRNCKNVDLADPANIFIPINNLVVRLGKEVSDKLEVNINAALAKLELNTLTALGSAVDMGYDGIEFTIDGKPVGSEMRMVEILVGREGIAPAKAETFIKQAKEQRHIKIYLSKKADFEPAEIPQYGDVPPDQQQTFGADKDGAFTNNLRAAVDTQDAQVVESMVISELLQATDMNSLVREYLPEINAAIDKLGRTLFLARLNMDKLSESQNSNEVMSFIANLRNVYRLLGDNSTKLERMVSGPEEAQEEAGTAK